MAFFATGRHRVKGENSRELALLSEVEKLPEIDISDPEQVRKRIQEYFAWCLKTNHVPQIVAMSRWLGCSRDTVHAWKVGSPNRKEHQIIILQAYRMIEEIMIDMLIAGKIPAATGIFMLKNWYDYRDRFDMDFDIFRREPERLTEAEIRKRCLDNAESIADMEDG